jgi:hypothetical protein
VAERRFGADERQSTKPLPRPILPLVATNLLKSLGDIHVPEVLARDPDELARSRKRAALWLTLLFWGASFGLATLTIYLDGKPQWLAISLIRILPALLGLGFWSLIEKFKVYVLSKKGKDEETFAMYRQLIAGQLDKDLYDRISTMVRVANS